MAGTVIYAGPYLMDSREWRRTSWLISTCDPTNFLVDNARADVFNLDAGKKLGTLHQP